MRRIRMLSVTDYTGNRKPSCAGDLHSQDLFDSGPVRPFQNQTERQLGNLIVKGDVKPGAVEVGESLEVVVDNVPESAESGGGWSQCGWYLFRCERASAVWPGEIW